MNNKVIIGLSVLFGLYVAFSAEAKADEYQGKTLTEFKGENTVVAIVKNKVSAGVNIKK